ncbi:MAG: hypothetical protein U1F20_01190 [Lysobacterales bacterium]
MNWNKGDWSASWRMRYIGAFDPATPTTARQPADGGCLHDLITGAPNAFCGVEVPYGSTTYHSFSVSYALPIRSPDDRAGRGQRVRQAAADHVPGTTC